MEDGAEERGGRDKDLMADAPRAQRGTLWGRRDGLALNWALLELKRTFVGVGKLR